MSITQVKSMVQFSRAGNLVWSAMTSLLPAGVVSFSIDDGVFKLGDGVTPYSQLPVLFTYGELISAQGGVSGLFEEPVIAQNGKIVVVTFDAGSNTTMYSVSDTSLAQLLTDIEAIETTNVGQDTAIAELLAIALGLDAGINTGGDNNIITIQNRRYSNSGTTVAGAQSQISSAITFVPGSHMEEVEFYRDVTKTSKVDKLSLVDGGIYYVDIVGFNNNVASVVCELTATNTDIIITNISGGLFSVQFNGLTDNGTYDEMPAVLVASVDDGTGNRTVKKAIACLVQKQQLIAAVYGGLDDEYLYSATIDSSDNIICAGYTASEGAGSYDALVIKFDSSLNIIARKRYGGSGNDVFYGVATDSSNNIICAGHTSSEGTGSTDGLVVKFDSNLNIIARKRYGGVNVEYFYGVAIDSTNNIICAGITNSEGVGSVDALVVKFDSSLNIIARKRYGGASADQFNAVAVDSSNNIICAGNTGSEGAGSDDALVVKFDSSLNIIARKRYGGSGNDYFYNVAVDSSNNIICAGSTASEGTGSYDVLVIKLPSNIPSGSFTGTVLTGLTLTDSTLTLADSALTLADSALTLADSVLTLGDSTLTLADSTLTLEKDILN